MLLHCLLCDAVTRYLLLTYNHCSLFLMAGYFSNHSPQPRFPPNKDGQATTAAAAATATAAASTMPAASPRARIPSRHFSTSLTDERLSAKEKSPGPAGSPGAPSVHPLRNTCVCPFSFPTEVLCAHSLPPSPTRPCTRRLQLGVLVQAAACAREQDHELRRGNQKDLCLPLRARHSLTLASPPPAR